MSDAAARYGPGVLYTPKDYLRELQISKQKRLLVEGSDDRDLLRRLFQQFFPEQARAVAIDTAEQLRDFDPPISPMGNRHKVEEICKRAASLRQAENLVGFVDREFREFDSEPGLRDLAPDHRRDGRLIWSRGHSVENYLFDFTCFSDKVREYIPADDLTPTVQLFEEVFQDAVRVACAVGLTGYHHPDQRLKLMADSMHWRCLGIANRRLSLDLAGWKQQFAKRNLSLSWVAEAEAQFAKWWSRVSSADYAVVRWLCHGHIGIATIWAAFGRCAYEMRTAAQTSEREAIADKTVPGKDQQPRFRGVVEQWTRHALQGQLDCPSVLFQLLHLST
jgi:hypothetical protein